MSGTGYLSSTDLFRLFFPTPMPVLWPRSRPISVGKLQSGLNSGAKTPSEQVERNRPKRLQAAQ